MRHALLLLSLLVAACGDDAGSQADGADTQTSDTSVLDTSPQGDSDGSGGGNRPPELERIGDRSVAVAQTLTITLTAKDADDDKLTYSVFGNLPDGARFDKGEHRFEWAPTEPDKTVFLTFVVSDGTDFDRETVRIQVTATATSSPPSFAEVGDQVLAANQPYELQLAATDPDGDRLKYGHEGALPTGAALDATTGKFTWRPGPEAAGAPVRITFTVSDGSSSDTLAVRFVVDDGSTPVPRPPTFTQIPPQTAKVGQALTLTLVAQDPDGDALTFTMQRQPPGATLSGATFSFTPAQEHAGQTYQVAFSASDGTFSAVMNVQISVTSGQTAACTPDANEPNDTFAAATAVQHGTSTANLCETETTYDTDVYRLAVTAGQELRVKLTFDGSLGDLDLTLVDANDTFLAESVGVTATEELRWTASADGEAWLYVYGYALEPLSVSYTLETSLAAPVGCSDDGYEDNDTPFDAKPLDDAAQAATHQICPDDEDFWTLSVGCGARVEIAMDILGAGQDFDMYLFDDLSVEDGPIASAFTENASEFIDVAQATRAGTWLLQISGYPEASAEGGYEVYSFISGACQDDGQAGGSRQAAKALATDGAELSGLKVCCSDDWYSLSLAAGDQVVIDMTVSGTGSVGAVVYAADGTTQVASKDPSPTGGLLFFSGDAGGLYYLKVSGAVGTSYGLGWTVEGAGGGGCTNLSCPQYEVCDYAATQCVSDFCLEDAECPADYVCRQTYCVDACFQDGDCRPGYACKGLDQGVAQGYCGVAGDGTTGASCSDFANCEAHLACLLQDHGGYCAALGCGACDAGTQCATIGETSFCARMCNTNADCREADGITCSAEKTCLPQNP